jgi:DNA-directed RNA polymerase subunit RPC12/RpoP
MHQIKHSEWYAGIRPPYKCRHCGRDFDHLHGARANYTAHLKDHLEEEMYECPVCSYAYRTQGPLTKHYEDEHTEGSTEHKCNTCDEVFQISEFLFTHFQKHPSHNIASKITQLEFDKLVLPLPDNPAG